MLKLDILVLPVHPDDAELGCAGTILKEIALGKKVGIVDLTRGELGTRGSAEIRCSRMPKSSLPSVWRPDSRPKPFDFGRDGPMRPQPRRSGCLRDR